MVRVKPFAALRPPKDIAPEVSARPYDVLSSAEALAEAAPESLLHITRPEIDFIPMLDEHDPEVYDKAVENFKLWQEKGYLVREAKPCYYVYAQRMGQRTQYGITLCAHTADYASGAIKKHELTRKEKEDDRMRHVLRQRANIEPVFFAYTDNDQINAIVEATVSSKAPEYDFIAKEDGFGHSFWVIDDEATIERLTECFAAVPAFYVADGHHRTAAAARVGEHLASENPSHTGDEEYNFFMAVCFPASQLHIMDYNRLVKDLAGYDVEGFLEALSKDFEVTILSKPRCGRPAKPVAPATLHTFTMYLDGKWYGLKAREGRYDDSDPIGCLDVTILSNLVLDSLLGIKDLRTDKRIDFAGGLRGLGFLQEKVDAGEAKVAFAMYPVSMKQLIDIADSGAIMPPKTTWFEPKLRSGLAIHTF